LGIMQILSTLFFDNYMVIKMQKLQLYICTYPFIIRHRAQNMYLLNNIIHTMIFLFSGWNGQASAPYTGRRFKIISEYLVANLFPDLSRVVSFNSINVSHRTPQSQLVELISHQSLYNIILLSI